MDRKRNHGSHEGHGREVLSDRPDTNPGVNALSEYLGIMESVNHLIVMDSESHGQHDVVTSTLQGESRVTPTSTVGAADAASACGVDAPSDINGAVGMMTSCRRCGVGMMFLEKPSV